MEELIKTTFDWSRMLPQAVKMALAFLIALPIAFNRERKTRIMGLRTFPLVAIVSCSYILIAVSIVGSEAQAQARIVQGLITGIGFVGGGAILKNDDGVVGTATAASIWATGAVGAAVAFGYIDIALILAVLTFIVLRIFTPLKQAIDEGEGV